MVKVVQRPSLHQICNTFALRANLSFRPVLVLTHSTYLHSYLITPYSLTPLVLSHSIIILISYSPLLPYSLSNSIIIYHIISIDDYHRSSLKIWVKSMLQMTVMDK